MLRSGPITRYPGRRPS